MSEEWMGGVGDSSRGGQIPELTAEQKEFAAAYLNEPVEPLRAQFIEEIRKWLPELGDLAHDLDDFFILRFLRGCKFDLEKSKRKLRNFYEQRSMSPEWFTNRDPFLPEMQEMLNLGVFLPLRKLDHEGRMVIIIRACVHNPRKHKLADVFKAGIMVLDLAARDHVASSIYGIVAVHDLTGVQLSHALQMSPGIIKRLVHTWQGYPNRIRSLEYINAPAHVTIVLNIFKRFMSKKLRQRMHVHRGDAKAMLKKLSPSVLPRDLGGTEEDYDTLKHYWKQQVEDNKQWFLDDKQTTLKDEKDQ